MEHARVAVPGDVPRLAELARGLRGELDTFRGGALWSAREARPEPLERAFADRLGQLGTRTVVGTIDGEVVGFATAVLATLHDGRRLGVVEEIYVEPAARTVGVGEAMVDDLLAFFTAAGCVGADALALPGHRATKNFFEGSGFTARALVMHRTLPPPDGVGE